MKFPGIAVVDFFLGLVIVFGVLLKLSIMAINVEAKTSTQIGKTVRTDAVYFIKMIWDGQSDDDVDIYVQDPLGHICFFKDKQTGLMNLDRDDTGRLSNSVTLPDGRLAVAANNEETVTFHGVIPGEYTVNIHLYSKMDRNPVSVNVTLYKATGDVEKSVDITLSEEHEEKTAFKFSMNSAGGVYGFSEEQGKKFVGRRQ